MKGHYTSVTTPIVCLVLLWGAIAHAADADPAWNPGPVLLSDERIDLLVSRIERKQDPTYAAFQKLLDRSDAYLNRDTHAPKVWYVPGYYVNAKGHTESKRGLQEDANAAYALALLYRLTGEEKYALGAARIINAWATQVEELKTKDDSRLSFSYHFPAMIVAADLLRPYARWPQGERSAFQRFIRDRALKLSTINSKNNWGNWGLLFSISASVYLGDRGLFDVCIKRWKELIDAQIAEDGHLIHEVNRNEGRSGVWYTHFSLMPQTLAAEVAFVNGVDLFDYISSSGHTLRSAYECAADWSLNPASFPYYKGDSSKLGGVRYVSYFEILNARWPNDSATALLKRQRPMTANHSAPLLTLTHGELLK